MEKKVILTNEGFKKLEKELEELKGVRRKEVAEKIKAALSLGDLSENSEYDEAKNEQAVVEARISQLEGMLRNVELLDEEGITTDVVCMGAGVVIKELGQNEEETYKIVGSTEADPISGSISDESPIGKALMGHKVGDVIEVDAPSGKLNFEVIKIFKV